MSRLSERDLERILRREGYELIDDGRRNTRRTASRPAPARVDSFAPSGDGLSVVLHNHRAPSTNPSLSRWHWTERREVMAEIKALVRDHLPDDLGAPFDRPCHIEIVGLFTGIPVDADNIFSKPYVDALIGPVIVDDSPDYVVSVKRSSYRSSVDLVEIRAYMQKERKGTR